MDAHLHAELACRDFGSAVDSNRTTADNNRLLVELSDERFDPIEPWELARPDNCYS
jgi:hypothetical protein